MYKLKAKRVTTEYFIYLGTQRIEKIIGNNLKITEEGEIPKLGEDLTAGINKLGTYLLDHTPVFFQFETNTLSKPKQENS